MGSLADFFPADMSNEANERLIRQLKGVIFYHQTNTYPPKEKFCIIVGCIHDKVAVVYINSIINQNVNYNSNLQSLHLPILKNDYQWLNYDSFIDCSKIYEKDISEILNLLKISLTDYYKCDITQLELDNIHDKLRVSPRMNRYVLAKYGI
jgi:hypothetical protein